jgi:hypothetical protein
MGRFADARRIPMDVVGRAAVTKASKETPSRE